MQGIPTISNPCSYWLSVVDGMLAWYGVGDCLHVMALVVGNTCNRLYCMQRGCTAQHTPVRASERASPCKIEFHVEGCGGAASKAD